MFNNIELLPIKSFIFKQERIAKGPGSKKREEDEAEDKVDASVSSGASFSPLQRD